MLYGKIGKKLFKFGYMLWAKMKWSVKLCETLCCPKQMRFRLLSLPGIEVCLAWCCQNVYGTKCSFMWWCISGYTLCKVIFLHVIVSYGIENISLVDSHTEWHFFASLYYVASRGFSATADVSVVSHCYADTWGGIRSARRTHCGHRWLSPNGMYWISSLVLWDISAVLLKLHFQH